MALKASIHKVSVQFSDLDRNIYGDHNITLARHPSETDERMMIRLLAYVLNAPSNNDRGLLEFGKDMWEPDDACLAQHDLTGLLEHWIDIGQPEEKRITRACGRGKRVTVYAYGNATTNWWNKAATRLSRIDNLIVWQLPSEQTEALATLADERSMDLQITLQDGGLWIGSGDRSIELTPVCLHGAA